MRGSITVQICDRCGYQEEMRKPEHIGKWGQFICIEVGGDRKIGKLAVQTYGTNHQIDAKDVCFTCMDKLFKWWNELKIADEEVAFTTLPEIPKVEPTEDYLDTDPQDDFGFR
jgi:hypothetical protein